MFTVVWKGEALTIQYQRTIDPTADAGPEWSWGPTDSCYLVPCSEAHALAMIQILDRSSKGLMIEVYP